MNASLNGPLGQISLPTTILTLGRVQDNQVVINDAKASSHHAEIRPTVNGYTIVDLGSTNGTFVNDQPLEPHRAHALKNADVIRIGDTRFTYTISDLVAVPPTVYVSSGNDSYLPTVGAPPSGYNNYMPPQVPPPGSFGQHPEYVPPPQPFVPPGQYPAYAPPPQPVYIPPQQPRKNLKWLWITLSIVGALLVVFCVVCGALALVAGASTPNKTLDTFCNDINNKQYHDAYLQLSVRAQSSSPESSFTNTFSNVNSCAHTNASENGDTGTANLTLTTRTGLAANFTVNLVKDTDNTWKIDNLQKPS